VSGEKDIVTIL